MMIRTKMRRDAWKGCQKLVKTERYPKKNSFLASIRI